MRSQAARSTSGVGDRLRRRKWTRLIRAHLAAGETVVAGVDALDPETRAWGLLIVTDRSLYLPRHPPGRVVALEKVSHATLTVAPFDERRPQAGWLTIVFVARDSLTLEIRGRRDQIFGIVDGFRPPC